MTRYFILRGIVWISMLLAVILADDSRSADNHLAFDANHWDLERAVVTEHLEQSCIMGTAQLKDIEFTNGVIEYDMAVDGRRCYPGVRFRMHGPGDFEEFYIRPHHASDPAALQYTPSFNGITGWQLYSGPGFTAAAEIPTDRWFHIKLEIAGTQARVFLDESVRPVLVVSELKHGLRGGSLLLQGPTDGQAYFANFRMQVTDDLVFATPLLRDPPEGVITSWRITSPLPVSRVDRERPLAKQDLGDVSWQDVTAEPGGLVDIARYHGRTGREPDCVFARTTITATGQKLKKFEFGYSDQISIFLNGRILFTGNSAYRSRDPSFLGAVGLHDAVFLDLREGENELLLMVTESFGGWGFLGRITEVGGEPIKQHPALAAVWDSGRTLSIPESVVYDAARQVFYVSNYYNRIPGDNPEGNEFLSKVSSIGEIEELTWITGLNRPTGQCIHGDRLFVVERSGLVEIDLQAGEIVARHTLPDAVFPNDVTVDAAGRAYVSDSNQGVIYRYQNGEAQVWCTDLALMNPNGLCIRDQHLLVGDSGDGCVKEIALDSRQIRHVACLGAGSIIDGLTSDEHGNLLVTDWNGRLLRINPEGEQTELLNLTVPQYNCADIAYLTDRQLVVIPTFMDNRLLAYEVK